VRDQASRRVARDARSIDGDDISWGDSTESAGQSGKPFFASHIEYKAMDQISAPSNNKMQQTSHGQDGGSLLILVFG
jgi:hypothetical protein